MSRKDFELIASAIASEYENAPNLQAAVSIGNVAFKLADTFEKENARFDRMTFLAVAFGRECPRCNALNNTMRHRGACKKVSNA
jgi:hypothetical protein